MLRVEVNYSPRLTRAEQTLLALPNRLRNLRPLMINVIAPEANRMLLRYWNSKGAAYGRVWAPWSDSTRAARIRKGNADKGLLRDTDHLFKAIFRERSTDDRLRTIEGGLRLQLNTRIPYAIFHQEGTINMPMRQVIPDPLPPSFIRTIRPLIRQFILSGKVR